VGSRFVLSSVFVTLAVVVVHKSGHINAERRALDWVVDCSVGFPIERVEVDGTVEVPDGRRGLAALPGSVDGRVGAVLIEVIRDAHLGFNAIYCFLEHSALDGGDIPVQTVSPANDASEVDDDSIIAGGRIVGEL
jgi:hypothetical protein